MEMKIIMKKQDIIKQISEEHQNHFDSLVRIDYANFYTISFKAVTPYENVLDDEWIILKFFFNKLSKFLFGVEPDQIRRSGYWVYLDFYNN